MDMCNRVSACPPAEAAVSAPPISIGYFPDSRRCLPTVTPDNVNAHKPPVTIAREQAPGKSASSSDTRSDTSM